MTISAHPNYEVSDLGLVRRKTPGPHTHAGRFLKPYPDKDGYLTVGMYKDGRVRTCKVATLVLEAFVGPKPSPDHEAAHGDGVRDHNALSNLRWATSKENQADRLAHGTAQFGEDNPNAHLSDTQIRLMRAHFAYGETKAQISRTFGCSDTHAHLIVTGRQRRQAGGYLPDDE